MNWLNRIPIWLWFLITFALVYGTWNPSGYSVADYLEEGGTPWSTRVLTMLLLLAVFLIYLIETFRTFRVMGLIVLFAIIASAFWKVYDWGMLDAANVTMWQWVTPGIVAFVLSLGLQGGRIYRNMTGRVPVAVDSHHEAPPIAPEHHPH